MRKKWINFFLFCSIATYSFAQTEGYKFYCPLDTVKESGFYNIIVTPELSAHLKTDYSDIRVVNSDGKWIPHILHFPAYENTNESIALDLKFTITANDKKTTILSIEAGQHIISNFGLQISNTVAERFATLSGSNDNNNWFVINDSILLSPSPDDANTKNIFRINFPATSYKFYKLVVQNNNKDPFEIKKVFQYTSVTTKAQNELQPNPGTTILQKDSGKISYIKITQQQFYHFDNISIKLNGAKYFNRKANLYIADVSNSFANPGKLVQSFTISNNSNLQFTVPLSNAKVFYLFINNEDNLPLQVQEINTLINYRYLSAYLDKANNYKLILDNEAATLPNYDLTGIDKKKPDSSYFLVFKSIIAFETIKVSPVAIKNNKWILWAALVAALFILLLFTQKMIKEVNKRKTDDSI